MANPTRRDFLTTTTAATAAWTIVPRHVLGQGLTPPSDLVNIAIVGIGGMGAANAQAVMSQNIVAICDVDDGLVNARIDDWKRSLQPRQPQPQRPTGPGRGGRGGGPRPPTTVIDWEVFGPSKL